MAVKSTKAKKTTKQEVPEDSVWTYRGYRISSSEFVTAMVHFFRAEVSRANVWRTRLDTTTNWAVVATAATLSIAFSQAETNHAVIILNTLLVTLFLYIEARRYRYYELWSYRVRLMETDFYAAMLVPPFQPSPDWAESLAENLLHPSYPISMWEALGRRLRRNYFWLFLILGMVWFAKLWLHPTPSTDFAVIMERAMIGPFQGEIVMTVGIAFYALLLVLGILTIRMTKATGEILPRFGQDVKIDQLAETMRGKQAWFSPRHKRQQYLAFIVTDKANEVSKAIMDELHRGVTALHGTGMYTGKERNILMCALTVTEVNHLKSATSNQDPNAFVVITSAHEVLGRGFNPLEEK